VGVHDRAVGSGEQLTAAGGFTNGDGETLFAAVARITAD